MRGDRIPTHVLSVQMIPQADAALRAALKLPEGFASLGILTTDCDDVSYTALDEATKKAEVRVVYARSMYAGSSNASTRLAGEFIGILAGPDPAEVRSGLEAAVRCAERDASFYSACGDDSVVYFAHCISRTGSYLSAQCGIPEGSPLAYLIAPPLESIYALDKALKAAQVRIVEFYGPPSPTNFGGGLLTGTQSDCKAACDAFARAVIQVASRPIDLTEH